LYAVIVNANDGQTLQDHDTHDASPFVAELPRSVGARKVSMAVICCN
jgi:hypothetical protein